MRIAISALLSLVISSGAYGHKQAAPPLTLKLSTQTATACFGRSLKVQAELVNESDEKVGVDVKTIWYQLSLNFFSVGPSRNNPDGSGSGRTSGGSLTKVRDGGPNYEGEYLILSPGESYKASRTIKLDDEFFNNVGSYRLKVTYGQFLDASFEGQPVWKGTVESKGLNLKMLNCKAARKRY